MALLTSSFVAIEEGFAERHRRQNTRFDFVAARPAKRAQAKARRHFAQNDAVYTRPTLNWP